MQRLSPRTSDNLLAHLDHASESESQVIQRLQDEVYNLQDQLEDCRTSIFDLLHEDEQISEATMRKNFRELTDSIDNWTERLLDEERTDFRNVFRSRLGDQAARKQLDRVGLDLPSHDLDQIGRISPCCLFVATLLIWNGLYADIFSKPLPIGLSNAHRKTISEVEHIMGKEGLGKNSEQKMKIVW